ncbi:MAG TPA: hypothetical protein VNE62_13235 [Actinomycetota bacterium]|nr:hypothetical protein [Actinomycetota bacterium]
MPLFGRRGAPKEPEPQGPPPEDLVRLYLRGQNLEQVRRTDEAVALYEQGVAARFDAAGPYDRLIHVYRTRSAHADVVRVASAALEFVRSHDAKRDWYETVRREAEVLLARRPDPSGAEF